MIEVIAHFPSYELTDLCSGAKRFCSVETLFDNLDDIGVDTSAMRDASTPTANDLEMFAYVFKCELSFRKAKKWVAQNLTTTKKPYLFFGPLRHDCGRAIGRRVSQSSFARALAANGILVKGDKVYAQHETLSMRQDHPPRLRKRRGV